MAHAAFVASLVCGPPRLSDRTCIDNPGCRQASLQQLYTPPLSFPATLLNSVGIFGFVRIGGYSNGMILAGMIVKKKSQEGLKEAKLYSMAALPVFSFVAERQVIREVHDWTLDEPAIKTIYMVFSIVFCWGCCVFASMNDPFYDSDLYRKAGGDGTQNWIYQMEENEELEAREELLREELLQEIEEKVGGMRELEEADKEKELV
eukprot:c21056_g1_i2 orf=195-809(+)